MTGRDIVLLAPTEWGGPWQRYHEVATRLGRAGNRVLVLDNLYRVTPPAPRGATGGAGAWLAKAWRALRDVSVTPRDIEPGLRVLAVPPPVGGVGQRLALAAIRRTLAPLRQPVLWCAFPSPLIPALRRALDPALLVYDCASAFAADPLTPHAVVDAEAALLRDADCVFTDARALWDAHAARTASCTWIPTGVDTARFTPAVALRAARRARTAAPMTLGYVGTLHGWIDVALIAAVAQLRPQWRIVLVGPRRLRADFSALEQLPQVQFAGPRAHADLPAAMAEFDAAWIPYRVTPFTDAVFPTKMLEYLAAGCPVVSTDLPEVRAFVPPVRIARTAEETVAAVEALLADPAVADAGIARAAAHDWSAALAQMHTVLDATLARRAEPQR